MTTILAIDPATRCGWAVLRNGNISAAGTWDLSAGRFEGGGMRYLKFRRRLSDAIALARPTLVAYEEVRRHLGNDAARVYGGLVAVLTSACEECGIPYMGVPVGTVKKTATGKGNADKAAMVAAARERWPGVEIEDDNQADAMFIALAAAGEAA